MHIRHGRINWRLVAWMAPPSIVGAVAGGYLAGAIPEWLLLAVIAAVLIQAAVELLRNPPKPAGGDGGELDIRAAVASGAVIGLLGGLVGLILGSLRMPALLRWVGETPQRAVGTNVTVGVFVGVAGSLAHLPNAAPDLDLIAGRRRRVDPRRAARLAPDGAAVGGGADQGDRRRAAGGRGGLHRPGPNLTGVDLQEETADVLGHLIRFNTVNPPGNERECQEWLKAYLEEAGFECELAGTSDERPNLVARLRGEADGPVLGYLSHVDTVLASPEDWSRDPWSGEQHDGFVWGRGAVDMKSQTAAEVVAGAALAREGWRPPRGELKIISVADEEVGGLVGAQWLTQERPDLARCDMLLNEGAGPRRSRMATAASSASPAPRRGRSASPSARAAAPATRRSPRSRTTRCSSCSRSSSGSARRRSSHDLTDPPRAFLSAIGLDPADPDGALRHASRGTDERLAAMIEPTFGVTFAPTIIEASAKINVIPARAELKVDCRMPSGMGAEETMARVREALGDTDGIEIEPLEEVIGNSSPVESPLMDAIRDWIGEAEPGAEVVPIAFCGLHRLAHVPRRVPRLRRLRLLPACRT